MRQFGFGVRCAALVLWVLGLVANQHLSSQHYSSTSLASELGRSELKKSIKASPGVKANVPMERAKKMLRKLKKSNKCGKMAKSHAKTLAKKNFRVGVGKSHFGFNKRVKQFGISGRVAEINANTKSGRLESALRAWLNSPSHRKQLLNSRNKSYGLSRSKGSNGKYYWVMCIEQK